MLRHFDGYRVVSRKVGDGRQIALAPDPEGRNLAAVFTSHDNALEYLQQVKEILGDDSVMSLTSGESLFTQLAGMPLDGIVFNCAGPGVPRAVSLAFATVVLEKGAEN